MRKVITIDGLAASGKSSISRALSEKIGFIHLNSGAHYRAVAYLLRESKLENTPENLAQLLKSNKIELYNSNGATDILINGKVCTEHLFSNDISILVSKVSAVPIVREALLDAQRHAFDGEDIVAEGRDMGTVVFSDASAKFFIVVDVEVRTRRRMQQLGLNQEIDFDRLKAELLQRDKRDQNREISPAVAAADALIIDNSRGSLTEVVENIYASLRKIGVLP